MKIIDIKNRKNENDKIKNNTYLIRLNNQKDSNCQWYTDELCFVRNVSEARVTIFRPFDNQEYILGEEEIKNFKLV